MIVNIHQAKTNLSKLIASLAKGEDVIIAKAGSPVAKLIAYHETSQRTPNTLKGKIKFIGDFDSANDEISQLFIDGD